MLSATGGRRSVAQLQGYEWKGDATSYVPILTVFPPADELMPGPIDGTTEFAAVPAAAAAGAPGNGASSNGSGDLEAAATS